jgi:hypothetical protein
VTRAIELEVDVGLAVGSEVGARRWPYDAAHPDCWGTPWKGVVLEVDDPRSWAGTFAFPMGAPDPQAVKLHVEVCRGLGLPLDVPVRWDFGRDGCRVYWEKASDLLPYDDDFAAWTAKRDEATAALSAKRDRALQP